MDACTLWEFNAMVRGYKRMNGIKETRDINDDRLREMGIVGFE